MKINIYNHHEFTGGCWGIMQHHSFANAACNDDDIVLINEVGRNRHMPP